MARPREFDRDAALDGALEQFWRHGFEGTSTAMLVEGMGIGRQSLYDTFGDKRRLYLEALRRYNDAGVGQAVETLATATSPLAGIVAVIEALVTPPAADRAKGCFGINAVCEHGVQAPDVAAITATSARRLETALVKAVEAGQHAGEITDELTPKAGADFVYAMMAALKVMARGGADEDTLHRTIRTGLRALTR